MTYNCQLLAQTSLGNFASIWHSNFEMCLCRPSADIYVKTCQCHLLQLYCFETIISVWFWTQTQLDAIGLFSMQYLCFDEELAVNDCIRYTSVWLCSEIVRLIKCESLFKFMFWEQTFTKAFFWWVDELQDCKSGKFFQCNAFHLQTCNSFNIFPNEFSPWT